MVSACIYFLKLWLSVSPFHTSVSCNLVLRQTSYLPITHPPRPKLQAGPPLFCILETGSRLRVLLPRSEVVLDQPMRPVERVAAPVAELV